jgi:hypothetical protein
MSWSKKMLRITPPHILLCMALVVSKGRSAPVNPAEAAAIADLWYAMELNSGYLKIDETDKMERFLQMGNHEVLYMVSKDELLEAYPVNRSVLAYVIEYAPDGFVVVSGDDRIEPIMVCSAVSEFRWDPPERNFLRYYLGVVMPALWQHMPAYTHKNWTLLRAKLAESRDIVTYDDAGRAIYVLWHTVPWSQSGFYNDTCQAHNGNNDVPTGCVATALAIKMKFHSWPMTGVGAHAYTDTSGDIQFSHSVNYGSQSYDWHSMPDTFVTSANAEVARIMYHAGVAVDMDYELAASGTNTLNAAGALNNHFRYRGTIEVYDDTLISTHTTAMSVSNVGKLPVQIGYWWVDTLGSHGHSVINDGYRDDIQDQWHMNCGWSGVNNGWYRLDHLPPGTGTIYKSCPYGQPNNWVYVNDAWTGSEDGRILHPYNTLLEGDAAAGAHGEMLIRTGTYTGSGNVPITFDNNNTIRAYAGDVLIGDNVWLENYAAIKLHDGGECKITP